MKYREVILNIANKLAEVLGEDIYHSAEIVSADQMKFPAVATKEEWKNLAPSDQYGVVYIRRNGSDLVLEELRMGSCVKAYKMQTGVRIVYFRDFEPNQNKIISQLLQSTLISGVKLNKMSIDKWALQKEESSGEYNFGPSTAYFAIDINVYWELMPNNCDEDFCIDDENPIKKCAITQSS